MRLLAIRQKPFRLCVLLVFLGLAFAGYNYNSNNHFGNNLIVELIGVTLEILVTLFIFDYWQESSKKQKLITIEKRLREYLIFFLKHNFKTIPSEYKIGRFYGSDHNKNIQDLNKLRNYISKSGLSPKEQKTIKQHCQKELSTLNSLLPVASELTDDHFKSWCRIVHFANCIAQDIEPTQKCTIDIIQNIIRFDTASFDNDLYVGAKNV